MPYYDDPLAMLRPGWIPGATGSGVFTGQPQMPDVPSQTDAQSAASPKFHMGDPGWSYSPDARAWQQSPVASPPPGPGGVPADNHDSVQSSVPSFMDYLRHPLGSAASWAASTRHQAPGSFLQQTPQGLGETQPPPAPPMAPSGPPQGIAALGMPSGPSAPPPAPPMQGSAPPPSPDQNIQGPPMPVPPQPPAGGPPQPALSAAMAPAAPSTGDMMAQPQGKRDVSALLPNIFTAESGNQNKKNPDSSASGNGQMLDPTFADFVNSPANTQGYTMADKNKLEAQKAAGDYTLSQNDGVFQTTLGRPATDAELRASWLVGGTGAAKLAAHPNDPIDSVLSPAAIKLNPAVLKAGMTGAEAIASADKFYGGAGGPQTASGTPPTAPTTTTGTTDTPGPQQGAQTPSQGDSGGLGPQDIQSLLNGIRPTSSQQLQALASGLLSGPTLGMGLGKGLQALGGQDAQYKNLALQVAQARATAGYHQGLLGAKAASLTEATDHHINQDDTAALRAKNQGDHYENQDVNAGVKLDLARQHQTVMDAANVSYKNSAAALADQRAQQIASGGVTQQKLDATDQDEFFKSLDNARDGNRAAADVLAILDKEGKAGLTGSDATSKVKRFFSTNLGIDVDGVSPSGIALAEKDLSNLQTKGIMGATNGRIPRAVAEYNGIGKGYGTLGTNPDALRAIVQGTVDSNNRLLSAGTTWRDTQPPERKALMQRYGGFSGWRDSYSAAQPDNASMTGATQPTPTIQPGANGSPWTHKDPTSGLGFTIH